MTMPDIVFLGGTPTAMPQIQAALKTYHLFVAAGASGTDFPGAGLAQEASSRGANRLLLTFERPEFLEHFSAMRLGPASQIVPEWVGEIVGTAAHVFRSDGQ